MTEYRIIFDETAGVHELYAVQDGSWEWLGAYEDRHTASEWAETLKMAGYPPKAR